MLLNCAHRIFWPAILPTYISIRKTGTLSRDARTFSRAAPSVPICSTPKKSMDAKPSSPLLQYRWDDCVGVVAIVVWAAIVCAGWVWMQRYGFEVNSPSAHGFAEVWPKDSTLTRNAVTPTLLVFMHPRCPCTRATLTELEKLLGRYTDEDNPLQTIAVSTVPITADAAWLDTVTTSRARLLPAAELFIDHDGREAERFGATTSGLVMLFDAEGNRKFAGGVTASRGHEGDNLGRSTLAKVLRGESVALPELPAFGCRLCLPGESADNASNESIAASTLKP